MKTFIRRELLIDLLWQQKIADGVIWEWLNIDAEHDEHPDYVVIEDVVDELSKILIQALESYGSSSSHTQNLPELII